MRLIMKLEGVVSMAYVHQAIIAVLRWPSEASYCEQAWLSRGD